MNVGTFVLAVGSGGWMTCWAVYFTRSVGLSPTVFAFGVTAGGLGSVLLGIPMGHWAGRLGVRETLVCLDLARGVAVLGYALVRNGWSFLLVTCVVALAQRSAPGIRIAVLTALADQGKPLDAISSGQVVAHAGFLAGSGLGAIALAAHSRAAYLAVLGLYAAGCVASGLATLRVPHLTSLTDLGVRRRSLVLRDRRFLAIAALCGVLALVWGVADVGVPLWVTTHTAAPPTVLGALIAVNAAAILLFQRRVARAATSVARSTRLTAVSAAALAASCVLFAATRGGSGVPVVVLLLVACVVQVVGELLFTASGWGISTGLTPQDAHAEYQSVFTAASAAAVMLAPALLGFLLVDWGVAGWFALGFVFLAAGLPTPTVGRWALRTPGRAEPPVTVS
ncbi:MFS transporter [Streptomyces javensis]|uniref:MFS transporter n=1 Tax=Streptomyces javensis TaxID=114698 RepID=A0ABS0R2W4_9ACTN|nr:MFS transporter [Streptomyces javensis]MBI0311453.1 hypothetical protein [Streptomyces javensis]